MLGPVTLASRLPGKASTGGYVYVVGFSEGTVKVGSTTDPRTRIPRHRTDAQAFGISIEKIWVSAPHGGYRVTERQLVEVAALAGNPRPGAEYFTGIAFEDVRAAAERLASGNPVAVDASDCFLEPGRPPTYGIQGNRRLSLADVAKITGASEARIESGWLDGSIEHLSRAGRPFMTGTQVINFLASTSKERAIDNEVARLALRVWSE